MLVSGIPDSVVGTNCWVLAPAAGEECLVVDPGFDVVDRLDAVLAEHRLRPAAVLLTHGHADHVWSVAPVCGARGVPALVHADDAHRLGDPLAGLGPQLRAMLQARFGDAARWSEPDDVRTLADRQHLELAGLGLEVLHAPGHTEGSAVFVLDDVPEEVSGAAGPGQRAALTSTVLSGDVLFAGSIGRTDLPGGDPGAMQRSLRDVVLPMPDDRLVLPGHGGATTIAQERSANPYLRQLS
ncbi:MBL fold metallo-hydrolase [Quadrisphaera sp. DSM 44207]|uniref:MBL fold metallo-hydrolase n=1 Tax=Quadrisphaera sp. DSM 44207 TaxID=1881057 RepID=UPI00088EB144|nr:MBL fold metallo-hydrolase [Quadrisphaera sp. DSM 44207]SDQ47490.1 Glyoxylase, beta-lactamase superfamily II [Quadrisphaera sp. DSM 44207]